MRKRNWQQYNRQLIQRGSLTFLIDPKIFKSLKLRPEKKHFGRPMEFPDSLILILLMIKIHYKLPYRMLEGFAKTFLLKMYPWLKIPTYSLICKRARQLGQVLPKLSHCRPHTILLDASGLKVVGEGEWKVKIHGRGRPRKWMKIHIAVDAKSQEIVAQVLTESHCDDGSMTDLLMHKSGKRVKTVIADGAYDRAKARRAVQKRNAIDLIPPPRNAKFRNDGSERDKALTLITGLGGDKQARSIWGKLVGYSKRSLVETAFSRLKRRYGDRMYSQTFERQVVETYVKCYILNRMNQIKI